MLITATSELAQIQNKLIDTVQQGHDAESKLEENNSSHQVAADKATGLSKDGCLGPEEADGAMEELMQAQATRTHSPLSFGVLRELHVLVGTVG